MKYISVRNTDRKIVVDDGDFKRMNAFNWNWRPNRAPHIVRYINPPPDRYDRERPETIGFAHELTHPRKGKQPQYIDGDLFNCRRNNIRMVDH